MIKMMRSQFDMSVQASIELLARIDLMYQSGPFISLNTSDDTKKASFRALNYRSVYDIAVLNQDFSVMMNDRSFFQFTEMKEQEAIRLAFYPNPYQFIEYIEEKKEALTLLEYGDISQTEFEQLLSEGNFTCDIPLIRFDLSVEQYCDMYHPTAHFHIGFHSDNRWPVRRILSPLAFMLKILKHYYPNLWKSIGEEECNGNNELDKLYREAVIKCPLLAEEYFSKVEEQRLYIS